MISIVQWFAAHPLAYYLLAFGTLAVFLALATWPRGSDQGTRKIEAALLFTAALALFACRWPIFFAPQSLNADEGMWVAGALKVWVDPVPWRGFDGTTSGPLCTYLLALPGLLGLPIDFLFTRIIGTALMAGTLFALYYTIKWICDAGIARLTLIPATFFLSLTTENDFIHFSSEYVPVFLIAAALAASAFLIGRASSNRGRILAGIVAGLCLGATGFAKLQSLPIALVVFSFVVVGIYLGWEQSKRETIRLAVAFAGSLMLVPSIIAFLLVSTGTWNDAVISYIRTSITWMGRGVLVGPSYFFGSAPSYTVFLGSILFVLFLALGAIPSVGLFRGQTRSGGLQPPSFFTVQARWLTTGTLLLLFSAVYSIMRPHRPYPHYLLFSIVPLSCCLAVALALLRQTRVWSRYQTMVCGILAALFALPAVAVALDPPNRFVRGLAQNSTRPLADPARAIARYTSPGERIAIWGWMPEYYVQTATIMATRDAHTWLQIAELPYSDYFQQRYLTDLKEHLPPVFVDAVAPGSCGLTDRATQSYESFPALADLIHEHYQLKEEISGVRIFVLEKP